jgi:hypothetical protein
MAVTTLHVAMPCTRQAAIWRARFSNEASSNQALRGPSTAHQSATAVAVLPAHVCVCQHRILKAVGMLVGEVEHAAAGTGGAAGVEGG